MKLRLCALMAVLLLFSFTGTDTARTFETANFTIQYPDLWRTTNDDGIINIFPDNEIGSITISGYRDLNLNEEQTKMLLLKAIGSPENPEKIKVKKHRGSLTYSYFYDDASQNAVWTAKAVVQGDLLYIVSIFCKKPYWNGNYKNLFLESYNSFKIKK